MRAYTQLLGFLGRSPIRSLFVYITLEIQKAVLRGFPCLENSL